MSITGKGLYVGGGKSGPVLLVAVTGQTPTSVTATLGSKTVSLVYDSTLGKWWAELTGTGTWTVTAAGSGKTVSTTVSATAVTVYEVTVALSRLPTGYTELEYIESTGVQRIDTGIPMTVIGTDLASFVFRFSITKGSTTMNFAGDLDNSCTKQFVVYYNGYTSQFRCDWVGSKWFYYILNVGQVYTIRQDGADFYFEEKSTTIDIQSSRANYTFHLFYNHNDNNVGYIRFYSLELSYNGSEYANLVPCKNSAGTVGLYDVVRKEFYGNIGTGTFIAGPEV